MFCLHFFFDFGLVQFQQFPQGSARQAGHSLQDCLGGPLAFPVVAGGLMLVSGMESQGELMLHLWSMKQPNQANYIANRG